MNTQDKELLHSFLNRTFFKDFKEQSDRVKLFGNLELQTTSKCNLDCVYCYYNNNAFGNELNPNSISKSKNIENNAEIFLNYLAENEMYPNKIDIFGGEPLNQPTTYRIIDKIINYYSEANIAGIISIPTNMSFLRSEKKTKEISELKKKCRRNNISLGLSASVDGKYMDQENRPVVNTDNQDKFYNDDFYDKLFSFAKKYGCGFHPMVHYNNIKRWKDNFMWFQENFEKYGLRWNSLYLLEVRNDGWTKESVNDFADFYKFVLNFVLHKKLNSNKEKFIKGFVFKGIDGHDDLTRMNMFNNIGTIGRGVGCSIQTTMQLRLGDLTVNPCHRQSYDALNGFRFIKDNDKIIDIEPLNLPYYLSIISTEHKTWPYCQNCLIKHTCMSGCMGAQYEATGDPFTPIPSVCLLEHGKVKAQIEFLEENGIFNEFIKHLREEQRITFEIFREQLFGGKYE